jgi:hypothetical protein
MSNAVSIIRQADEGELMWFAGGGAFTWKATSAETGGAFIMLEDRMVRGKTTPFHLHPNEDEAIYVLEGELLVDVEGEQHHVGPAASSSRRAASRTPSWSPPRPRACCPCRRPGPERPSTATRASRSGRWPTPRGRPTGHGCERSRSDSESIELVGPPPFATPQPDAAPAAS